MLQLSRIRLFALAGLACAGALLVGCSHRPDKWNGTDVTGTLPDLQFTMTRAGDGKQITAAAYRGKVTLLYFGYTFCPDICPLTLSNVTQALNRLADKAHEVRVLFVTVDPDRDTLDVLRSYTSAFAPESVGLRGTPDQLATLAKRYRVAYSAGKDSRGEYVVTHSSIVFAFDKQGKARLIYTNLSKPSADTKGMAADLKRLADAGEGGGWFSWL